MMWLVGIIGAAVFFGLLAAIPRELVKDLHKGLVDAGIEHWPVGRVEAAEQPGVRLT